VYGIASSGDFAEIVIILGASLAALCSGVIGIILAGAGAGAGDDGLETRNEKLVGYTLFVAGLPVGLLAFGVARLVKGWNRDWNDVAGKVIVSVFVLALAAVVVWAAVLFTLEYGLLFWGIIGGCLLGGALIVLGLKLLVTFVEGRRKQRREEDKKVWLDDEEPTYVSVAPPKKSRTPSRFERALLRFLDAFGGLIVTVASAIADFLIFVFQVARVKKWKICPMVEIPRGSDNFIENDSFEESAEGWR